MRASRFNCRATPNEFAELVGVDAANRICMFKNRHATARVFVQFGNQQGNVDEAWPIEPGETFTLDPAAPKERIWLASDAADTEVCVLLG